MLPLISLKVAPEPIPSVGLPAPPPPANVVTLHTQGGSTLSPLAAQFEGLLQGTIGAGEPPGQKKPGGHSTAVPRVVPEAQPYPGMEVQVPEQAAEARPVTLPKTPAGHK